MRSAKMCAAGSRDLALLQLGQYDPTVTRYLLCHYRRPANDNGILPTERAGTNSIAAEMILVCALMPALAISPAQRAGTNLMDAGITLFCTLMSALTDSPLFSPTMAT